MLATRQRPMAPSEDMRVPGDIVLAHDYLNQRGGAERVALELARMHPEAPVYTSLYRPESTFPEFAEHDIRTSFLDRLPVDRRFRTLLPLYPAAMRSLGPLDADVVISSSSAWAHGIRTTENTFHVVYCHNPARWLYGACYMRTNRYAKMIAKPFLPPLRRWDRRAAARADLYLANSENTRERIARVYGRRALVVPPPVDVDRFTPRPRGDRLLVVNRLLPYKRIDVVVQAATRASVPLDVVGTGPQLDDLRALAGPTVEFLGNVCDAELKELFETCNALCVAGEEDFGIAAVEAQAAGKPVITIAAGGALETVTHGFSGVYFSEPTVESLLDAIYRCDALDSDHEAIAAGVQCFSVQAFRRRIAKVVTKAREDWLAGSVELVQALSPAA
jgi:glycosyltransferase involved in cell wall biosynthesis